METKPVVEFDHLSAEYAADPIGTLDAMRAKCPVAWTDAHDGFWVTASYDALFAASRDDETFSSKKGRHGDLDYVGITIPCEPSLRLLPIELDPPELRPFRSVLNPAFGPKVVAGLVPQFERLATWCIDEVIESGEIDFVQDLTSPVPAMGTLLVVGLPVDDWPRHAHAFHGLVAHDPGTPEYDEALAGIHAIGQMLMSEIADRRANPREDLITMLVGADFGGRKLSDEDIVGILITTLGGGIDATTALIAVAWRACCCSTVSRAS